MSKSLEVGRATKGRSAPPYSRGELIGSFALRSAQTASSCLFSRERTMKCRYTESGICANLSGSCLCSESTMDCCANCTHYLGGLCSRSSITHAKPVEVSRFKGPPTHLGAMPCMDQKNPGNRGKGNGVNASNGSSQSARKNTASVTTEPIPSNPTSSLSRARKRR